MKKNISLLLCFCIITSMLMITSFAQSQQTIKVIVDPKIMLNWNGDIFYPTESDGSMVYPITYNNRTYLPARFIAERAGISINWDGKTQTVSFTSGRAAIFNNGNVNTASLNKYAAMAVINPSISLKWNGTEFQIKESNGENIYPIIYKGRTYLPARFIAEKAGVEVLWDGQTQTVMFSTNISGSPDKDGENTNNQTNPYTFEGDYESSDGRFKANLWELNYIANGEPSMVSIQKVYDLINQWAFCFSTEKISGYKIYLGFSQDIKTGVTYTQADATKDNSSKELYWDLEFDRDSPEDSIRTYLGDSRIQNAKLRVDRYNGPDEVCTGYFAFDLTQENGEKTYFEGFFAVKPEKSKLWDTTTDDSNTSENPTNSNTDSDTDNSNSTYNPPVVVPYTPPVITRPDNKICPDCNGAGRKICPICDGTGDSHSSSIFGCPACMGTGTQPCVRCGGDGYSMW